MRHNKEDFDLGLKNKNGKEKHDILRSQIASKPQKEKTNLRWRLHKISGKDRNNMLIIFEELNFVRLNNHQNFIQSDHNKS